MKLLREIFRIRRGTIILLACLLLLDIVLYGVVSHQGPRLGELQSKLAEKSRQAAAGTARDAATVYRQGTADLKTFRDRIPAKRDFARTLGELFDLASNNGLKISNISYKPGPVKGQEGLAVYEMSFSVVGRYPAVKSFISDILRWKNIITVETLSLNSAKATEDTVDLKVQVSQYLRMEER